MSFASDVQRWADEVAGGNLDQVVRALRLQALEGVIEKMPVDTGQAKGATFVSIGAPSSQVSGQEDSSPLGSSANAVARAQSVINSNTDQIFYITNNLPYVPLLEFGGYGMGPKTINGFSIQAPEGMFRITAVELRDGVRRIVNGLA